MQKACQIRVYGKVQGVGFRYFTQSMANKSGIKGFAKNMPDNSVYIEAEGDESSIAIFAQWCSRGPALARVTHIEIHPQPFVGFQSFEIR